MRTCLLIAAWEKRSGRDRGVGADQLLVLELGPQDRRGSGGGRRRGSVRPASRAIAPGMIEATIGCPSGNCSAAAGSGTRWRAQTALDLPDPLENCGAGRLVVVHRARDRAGRENPGIVAPADHDADAALGAAREFARRARPVRAACSASRAGRSPCRTGRGSAGSLPIELKPAPIPPITPGLAQFRERPPAARLELREIGGERRGIVVPGVEIVN